MLLVLEGIDGCGKETQIALLRKRMPDAALFKYPTRNFQILGDYLEKRREISPKALFLLFLSDIADEQRKVEAALKAGKPVILDRYVFSTIAYELDALGFDQARDLVRSVGFIEPDLVLLLDIDGKTSQARKRKQKELDRYEEDSGYLSKVRSAYLRLEREGFLAKKWTRIDAKKGIEDVHADIMAALPRG